MARGIHLVAGPVRFDSRDASVSPRVVEELKWEFIGFSGTGDVRRYQLCYIVKERRFRHYLMPHSTEDKLQVARLQDFYRPISVLRSMLPKGTITDFLRAMLTDADVARCTLLSINQGRA